MDIFDAFDIMRNECWPNKYSRPMGPTVEVFIDAAPIDKALLALFCQLCSIQPNHYLTTRIYERDVESPSSEMNSIGTNQYRLSSIENRPSEIRALPNQEVFYNHVMGLINRWPFRENILSNKVSDYWKFTKLRGILEFPAILEDETQTTCVRIPLAIVKGILVILGVEEEYNLRVLHFSKNQLRSAIIKLEKNDDKNRSDKALKAMDFYPEKHGPIFNQLEPEWRIFALAFLVFANRGVRRISKEHFYTLIQTAALCQMRATHMYNKTIYCEDAELHERSIASALKEVDCSGARALMREANVLQDSTDLYTMGVFSSFEMCLILAKDWAICSRMFPPVDLFDFFDYRLALKLHQVPPKMTFNRRCGTALYYHRVSGMFNKIMDTIDWVPKRKRRS